MKNLLEFMGKPHEVSKFDFKMKLSLLYMFFVIITVQASSYSQSKKLTLDMNDVSVQSVLDKIEEQSVFKFVFNTKAVNLERVVSVKRKDVLIDTILKDLFDGTHTNYTIDGSKILLRKTKEPKRDLRNQYEESTLKEEQQDGFQVHGTVVDELGNPLPAASIVEKGTSNGVVTDFDGKFEITVSNETAILAVSYLGYLSREVSVNAQDELFIRLQPDTSKLDEVVIVGYGSTKRSDLTGSIVSIGDDEITAFPSNDVVQAMQGRAAGLSITQRNGEPGSDFKVSIRGNTSINAASDPLFVVDGLPGGVIPPPEDIQSIEILKDASATAIYGSRGANGVILITTKNGKIGKPVLSINTSYSFQERIGEIDVLNGSEYAAYINEVDPGFYDNTSFGRGTDWQDEIFRSGGLQNLQLSLSAGTDDIQYYISGAYYDQIGIVANSDYKRYSITGNVKVKASDRLDVGVNLFARGSKLNGTNSQRSPGSSQADVIAGAYTFPTTLDIFDEEGNYIPSNRGFQIDNPVAVANELSQETLTDVFQGNAYGEYRILKDLKFRSSVGGKVNSSRYGRYYPTTLLRGESLDGEAELRFQKSREILTENYFTFSPTIAEKHKFDIVGGTSFQYFSSESTTTFATGFPSDDNLWWDLGSASDPANVFSSLNKSELYSFYGRINYSLAGKYLLTLSGRYDGSSVLADENKWQFFPSAAIAWNVKEEAFLADSEAISLLKFRASYGETGNQSIGPYQSLAQFTSVFTTQGNNVVTALRPSNIGNPDLVWETTEQINFGLDLGLFKNSLSLSAEYYRMDTSDLLFSVELPGYIGVPTQLRNIGKVRNQGLEFSLGARLFGGESKFSWNIDANLSANNNEILNLVENDTDGNDILYGSVPLEGSGALESQILREGESVGSFYGYVYDGVLQTGETALPGAHSSDQDPGGRIFRDINGDGELTPDDRIIIGNPHPDFTYGLNNVFTYGNLDLNIFIQGSQGGDILNYTAMELGLQNGRTNAAKSSLGRWTPSNTDTNIPSANIDRVPVVSNRWVEDGSFIRLKNVSLGYNFSDELLKKIGFSSLRVYMSAQNLFTITDYSGVDPDVAYANSLGSASSNRNLGLDYATYPNVRSYTLGLNISL